MKPIYKFLFLISIIFFPFCVLAQSEAFFTPSKDCENNIIKYIKKSSKNIDVAVYAINNENIIESLIQAHKKGIKIRILTDRMQAGHKSSKVKTLEKAGLSVKRHRKYKIQHDKFAIFDNKTIVTGSYNWTNAATHRNGENCLFLQDKSVQKYINRFDFLWKENSKPYKLRKRSKAPCKI